MSNNFGQTIDQLQRQISIIKRLIILYQQLLNKLRKKTLVIIHWTATPRRTTFDSVDKMHRIRKYPKSLLGYHIAYNALITEDAIIHYGRTYMEKGHGVGILRGFYIDICLTGMPTEPPNNLQIATLAKELEGIKSIHGKIIVRPHSYYWNTQCPGNKLRALIKGQLT